jgi:hypothetical protein
MNCPACNDVVADESLFCPNCGTVFGAKVQQAQLHNTRPPKEIAALSFWFEPGMEKVKGLLGSDTNRVTRKIDFAFQLVDAENKTTACDGEVLIKAKIYQGYNADYGMSGTQWKYLTNTPLQQRLPARTAEYYRASQGKLWWKYAHPVPFNIVSGYNVSCEIEVWFTPSAGGQKLYKKDAFSLDFAA